MNLRGYWNHLHPRERRTLLIGAATLLLLLAYAFLWHPFNRELKRLDASVTELRSTLAWMEQSAEEAKKLRGSHRAPAETGRQSLLTLVDSTAKAQGLGESLKRVQPEGETVRVWLEQAQFDTLLRWVDQVGVKHGVRVTGMTVEPGKAPGRVDARIALAGRQP